MSEIKFKEDDFTEAELVLLRLAFKVLDITVDMHMHNGGCYIYSRNDLFDLKQKLGIYDLLD